jgi:hypothetical protein
LALDINTHNIFEILIALLDLIHDVNFADRKAIYVPRLFSFFAFFVLTWPLTI